MLISPPSRIATQAAAIGAMRAKASEIRRELSEATVKYGGRHPTVVALKAQLADVNRQVDNETARTVAQCRKQVPRGGEPRAVDRGEP